MPYPSWPGDHSSLRQYLSGIGSCRQKRISFSALPALHGRLYGCCQEENSPSLLPALHESVSMCCCCQEGISPSALRALHRRLSGRCCRLENKPFPLPTLHGRPSRCCCCQEGNHPSPLPALGACPGAAPHPSEGQVPMWASPCTHGPGEHTSQWRSDAPGWRAQF